MAYIWEKISRWGIFWGAVYGLVGLGFYFSPLMLVLLGMGSLATAVALQEILFEGYKWHFAIIGLVLVFITSMLYLRSHGVRKLTLVDVKIHRVFIGTMTVAFFATYIVLFVMAMFLLRSSS